jgi:predicted extracellular nuclease
MVSGFMLQSQANSLAVRKFTSTQPVNCFLSMHQDNMTMTSISEVRGSGLWFELAGQVVTVQGVVTGAVRHGFFTQEPASSPDPLVSDAVFVFSPDNRAINPVTTPT